MPTSICIWRLIVLWPDSACVCMCARNGTMGKTGLNVTWMVPQHEGFYDALSSCTLAARGKKKVVDTTICVDKDDWDRFVTRVCVCVCGRHGVKCWHPLLTPATTARPTTTARQRVDPPPPRPKVCGAVAKIPPWAVLTLLLFSLLICH